METGCEALDLESEYPETVPLLMEQSVPPSEHVVLDIGSGSIPVQIRSTSASPRLQNETPVSAETFSRDSTLVSNETALPSSSSQLGRPQNELGSRRRASPLNSGLWISIEFTVTISQIVASIVVLSLSRDEKPRSPLSTWIIGYSAGCVATLPLLYWRYTHRYIHVREHDSVAQSTQHSSNPLDHTMSLPSLSQNDDGHENPSSLRTSGSHVQSREPSRMGRLIEKFKIVLDCFFAVWFVVGNVWIFGGHSSSTEAPNLYRLCIVFLTFSCIGYAMPFILCATICCCLPCIIALLGFREEPTQGRGAAPEAIAALPIYKFKKITRREERKEKDGSDSEGEGSSEGGLIAIGTESERAVPAEDANCCICLAKYKDGVDLKELPCTHHFHADCVDKWLKISACCPLCKHEIGASCDQNREAGSEATGSGTQVPQEVEV